MALLPGVKPDTRFGDGFNPSQDPKRVGVGKILKYSFLPGILPRIRRLGQSLGHFAFLLALIFRSARLLPVGHPMLMSANIGRFGFVDVISAAANNLVVSRKNVDQIMIFGAILLAIVMIFIQVIMIGFYAILMPNAANAADSGMFTSPNADSDVVLTFLQQVAGVDGFFNNSPAVGFSIAKSLHQMLGFYSTGLMIIATIIVIYYVITVVGESAQSGQPFGRRFNGLWAPVRLVLALGMLVPLGSGLNAAQYVALSIAKMGSGFATQAWIKFNDTMYENIGPAQLIPPVYANGFAETAKSIMLFETCAESYNMQQDPSAPKIVAKLLLPKSNPIKSDVASAASGLAVAQNGDASARYFSVSWTVPREDARESAGRFSCGYIKINYAPSDNDAVTGAISKSVITAYVKAISETIKTVHPKAIEYARRATPAQGNAEYNKSEALSDSQFLTDAIIAADRLLHTSVKGDFPDFSRKVIDKVMGEDATKGGWGNAANYYGRLALANQIVAENIKGATPQLNQSNIQAMLEATLDKEAPWFSPNTKLGDQAKAIKSSLARVQTDVLNDLPMVAGSFISERTDAGDAPLQSNTGFSPMRWLFNMILGGDAFTAIIDPQNRGVFPMALLSNLGAALITKAEIAFGLGAAASLGGVASGLFGGAIAGFFSAGAAAPAGVVVGAALGGFLKGLAGLIFFLGFIGLGAGFLLMYVLPFMPFIYFFFAIVEWAMGVLEAMLGAPLWALAHLRIEGDGIPGQAAMNGYNILFGLLLRPFFILFGLLASYVMFNSGAFFLNTVFDGMLRIVTDGGDKVEGQFLGIGYTGYILLYVIIVYNLGLVCFKMIDQIPSQAMRWMGVGDMQYKDGKPDPIGNISGSTTAIGGVIGGQMAGHVSGVFGQTGAGAKAGKEERRDMLLKKPPKDDVNVQ